MNGINLSGHICGNICCCIIVAHSITASPFSYMFSLSDKYVGQHTPLSPPRTNVLSHDTIHYTGRTRADLSDEEAGA